MRSRVPSSAIRVVVPALCLALPACGGPLAEPPAPEAQEPGPPAETAARTLSGPSGVEVPLWGTADLAVTLSELGRPVEGAAVDFALPADAAPARLSALRGVTDAAGGVAVRVVGGGVAGAFAVTALAEAAAPLRIPVSVGPTAPTAGLLRVAVRPVPGAPAPDEVALEILDGEAAACADGPPPADAVLGAAVLAPGVDAWEFPELPPHRVLSLRARASREGVEVAAACRSGLAVAPGEVTEFTAQLEALPADAGGNWHLVHELTLPEGLSAAGADVVETLAPAFDAPDDPARWLVEGVEEASGLSLGAYRDAAVRRVAAVLDQSLSPAALGLPGHLEHSLAALTMLGVESEATVGPGPCGDASLEERWTALRFDPGCDAEAGCGGRGLALPEPAPRLVRPLAGDPLVAELPEHVLPFPLGRVVVLFVREVVWPGLAPGATDTRTLLRGLVGCRAVGRAIAAADGLDDGRLGIAFTLATETTLSLACGQALDELALRTDAVLARLGETLHPVLTSSGSGRWVDPDGDGAPELLVGGAWCGRLAAPWGDPPLCARFEGVRP